VTVLSADRVGKVFGTRRVFSDIEFRVETGGVLAITGPNGSGKTTLLRLIAGLVRPTVGAIRVEQEGQELGGARRRNAIGAAGPDLPLFPELTAAENLSFIARVRGVEWNSDLCKRWLSRAGLSGREDDLLSTYSSGMRRRAGLAAACLHEPTVLLLDEPGSNLDSGGEKLVRELVEDQRGRGLTVIATNNKEEADYADERVALG
jgi:heme exporter protein A